MSKAQIDLPSQQKTSSSPDLQQETQSILDLQLSSQMEALETQFNLHLQARSDSTNTASTILPTEEEENHDSLVLEARTRMTDPTPTNPPSEETVSKLTLSYWRI